MNNEKSTIFIFIGGYLPGKKYGGPVTSIENFVNQLYDRYDMRIVCNDHDFNETERYQGIKSGWNQLGNAKAWFLNEVDYSEKVFEKIMVPFKKSICMVYLSGIYYYKMNHAAIKAAKKLELPVVSAPRGDLMKNSIAMNGFLSKCKKKVFLIVTRYRGVYKNVYIQATSEEERKGAKKYLGIPEDKIFNIQNLPMKPVKIESKHKSKNKLNILFMSRIMIKKNLLDTIKAIKLVDSKYTIHLDIYGSIEDQSYWEKCLALIDEVESPNKVIRYRGSLDTSEARKKYHEFDCFILPTLSENYGHVIAEALLSNCPVVLTRGTTPWDKYEGHGVFLSILHDIPDLVKKIEDLAAMDAYEYESMRQSNNHFILAEMKVDKLLEAYVEMIRKIHR